MWITGLLLAIGGIGWICSSNQSLPHNQGRVLSDDAFNQMCRETRGKSPTERRRIIKAYTQR